MSGAASLEIEHASDLNQAVSAPGLPEPVVSVVGPDEFQIELMELDNEPLWDQSVATASGQGCISSPGGPTC